MTRARGSPGVFRPRNIFLKDRDAVLGDLGIAKAEWYFSKAFCLRDFAEGIAFPVFSLFFVVFFSTFGY